MSLILIPIATGLWLKYKFREINLILIALISIGITQGLCGNIAFISGIVDFNWGAIKGLLLVILFIVTMGRFKNLKLKLPISFVAWSIIFALLYLVVLGHIFEAINNGSAINAFNVLQNFALVNMLMVFVAFFGYEEKQAVSVVDSLIYLGKPISLFAIFQWVAFKYYEIDVSLMMAAKGFGSMNSDDGEALRVFSTFDTHYGLSAFLTLITVLYVSRSFYKPEKFSFGMLGLFVIAHSLTFNLTGLFLTVSGCVFSVVLYKQKNKLRLSKPIISRIIVFSLIVFSLALLNPTFKQRILGIADYSETSSGAGNSLYLRNVFIRNALDILASNPNGVGLSLTDTSTENYEDLGYVRTGVINRPISADSWFLWLTLQIGLFFIVILALIYLTPFTVGLLSFKTIVPSLQWQACACTSAVLVVLLGLISNSPILNYPPSNIFIWWLVGTLFAIIRIKQSTFTPLK